MEWKGATELAKHLVPIRDLDLDPDNARHHPDINHAAILASLERFGQVKGVVIHKFYRKRRPTVIAGNGLVKAALELGWSKISTVKFEGNDDDARAYAIADNQTNELSTWDYGILAAQLEALQENYDDWTVTGFTQEDYEHVKAMAFPDEPPSGDDLTEPPVPDEVDVRVEPGDTWFLGDHILHCADSTKIESYEALMAGQHADLVFTDPPYNVSYEGGTSEKLTIDNDSMPPEQFRSFLDDAIRCLLLSLRPGGSFYVCAPAGPDETVFRNALQAQVALRQCIVWVKDVFVMGRQDYHWRHESILYGWKEGAAHYFLNDRTQDTVWEIDRPRASREHPTMKPVELAAKAISNSTKRGGIVLDPFVGSGTTILACEQLGRRARAIELSPRYASVALDRWEALTGQQAERLRQEAEAGG